MTGDSLMIHGGVTSAGFGNDIRYLQDMWIFNTKTNIWSIFYPKYGRLPCLAYHTMCVSNYDTNLKFNDKILASPKTVDVLVKIDTDSNYSPSKLEDINGPKPNVPGLRMKKRASLLYSQKNSQIYCFGGKDEYNEPRNDLYIIEVDNYGGNCTKIKTSGNKPSSRYGHGMWYMEKGSQCGDLIIYGGRNDYHSETFGKNDYRDVWMINTKYFCWINIKIG